MKISLLKCFLEKADWFCTVLCVSSLREVGLLYCLCNISQTDREMCVPKNLK